MKDNIGETIRKINFLSAGMSELYHYAALKIGLTDSEMIVMYAIYDKEGECLLSDIYKQSGVSKQTINSAVRKLEKLGVIRLENYSQRKKNVLFTEKGKEYAKETIARIFDAETRAFATWEEEDVNKYMEYIEKELTSLKREMEKL